MIELRVLALVGLIVTVIVSSLVAAGVATLTRRIQRARHSTLERADLGARSATPARSARAPAPPGSGASLERQVGAPQAAWRLRC